MMAWLWTARQHTFAKKDTYWDCEATQLLHAFLLQEPAGKCKQVAPMQEAWHTDLPAALNMQLSLHLHIARSAGRT